jgi:hypothetical protein
MDIIQCIKSSFHHSEDPVGPVGACEGTGGNHASSLVGGARRKRETL